MIPVYKPYLPIGATKHAHDAIDSGWLSSHGVYIERSQLHLQQLLEVKHVLLTNNGTTATHLVAKALKYKHPHIKRLLVPNNVYVAAINAFLFDKDFHLQTVDADINTWNYDLDKLDAAIKSAKEPTAVLIVHNIGNVLNVVNLKSKYPHVVFVEDNCEGFLGKYEQFHTGTSSLAGAISFFGNKNATSGEGGAVLTNDSHLYEYMRCVHGQGQSAVRFIHQELGYNYRMTNVQAAVLLGQLELLPDIFDKKNVIFDEYRHHVASREDVVAQTITPYTRHSNWMFGVRIPKMTSYAAAEQFFNKESVEIRPMFYPLSAHAHLNQNPNITIGDETVAKELNRTCFILPSYPSLSTGERKHILKTLDRFLLGIK